MSTCSDPRVAIVVVTHNRREEVLCSLKRHAQLSEQPQIIDGRQQYPRNGQEDLPTSIVADILNRSGRFPD